MCVCVCVCATKAEAAHISAACQADFKALHASLCRSVFAEVCVQWRQQPASSCLLSVKMSAAPSSTVRQIKNSREEKCGIDRKRSNTK